ncbi:MAG: hypothetical protein KGJ62_07095 [Armatimonadetes bacterium]|nr:hypothetical protein [Armatimonadota bacterium]MDE2207300.1 hypothetical protein [Armatimonadota bacterium]
MHGLGDQPFDRLLSATKLTWLANNCDVIAIPPQLLPPGAFAPAVRAHPAFTPLLYLHASSNSEDSSAMGMVGDWQPAMKKWQLLGQNGKPVPYLAPKGHWMDYTLPAWEAFWKARAIRLMQQTGAQGVVAADLPIGNTYVPSHLLHYDGRADLIRATADFLRATYDRGYYLLAPSSAGFDLLVGQATLPIAGAASERNLRGRLWDEFYPEMDGCWAEGWVRPYWANAPLPEADWEVEMEAADRAAKSGQVFIADAAYRNTRELVYALASYLLVARRSSRFVFQPMPLAPGQAVDAGLDLSVFQNEIKRNSAWFNAPLGAAIQERHQVIGIGGGVWRRAFEFGAVYVNSSDGRTVTVDLAGGMRLPTGPVVHQVVLPPHSGAILLFIPQAPKPEKRP